MYKLVIVDFLMQFYPHVQGENSNYDFYTLKRKLCWLKKYIWFCSEKQLCIFSSCNVDAFTGFLPMRHYRYKLQLLYFAIFTVAYYIRRSISVITLKRIRDYEKLSLTSCHRWLYLPLTHFNVFESIQRCSFVNNHSKLRIR